MPQHVELGGIAERKLIIAAAEDAQRMILLRVDAGRQGQPEAKGMALGGVALQAEGSGIEGEAFVVVVEAKLVGAAPAGASDIEHVAALEIREGTDVSGPLGRPLQPLLHGLLESRAGRLRARPRRPKRQREQERQPDTRRPISAFYSMGRRTGKG